MKIKIILILLFLLFPLSSVKPCSCVSNELPFRKKIKEAFENAELIITGIVVDLKEILSYASSIYSGGPIIYTFEVTKIIKGESKVTRLDILSARSDASCGYRFRLGETYLVYAIKSEHFSKQTGIESSFITSVCNRNKLLNDTEKREINILQRMSNR
ncbi:hypothetical protein [Aquimarina sp. SS2-1]|uniref:hypothetical protein n=1 Tax=Aquimarina besae TaxID=3342247 RepID=UPI00366C9474